MIKFFFIIGVFLVGIGCSKDETKLNNKLVGLWVEKNPELFDGVSDTLELTNNLIVRKHFYFKDWNYNIHSDTIFIQKGETIRKFSFSFVNENEIIIYNFIDRSVTSVVKDIYFIKNK